MKFRKRIASALLSLSMAVMPIPQFFTTGAIAAEAEDYTLCDIVVNGGGLIDFQPDTTEYEIIVPYKYTENDFESFPIPEVSATPIDSNMSVEVVKPFSATDGEKIYIYVKDSDETVQNTYTLSIKTAGRNLFADGGFETLANTGYTTKLNNGTLVGEDGTKLNFPTIIDIPDGAGGAGEKVLHGIGGTDSNGFNASIFQGTTTSEDTDVYMERGKTYVNGFMARLYNYEEGDETSFDADVTSPNTGSNPRYSANRVKFAGAYYNQDTAQQAAADNASITLTNDWGKYMALAVFDQDITLNGQTEKIDKIRVGVDVGSNKASAKTEFLYDEMYLGELVLAEASLTSELEKSSLQIPEEETSVPLKLTMANQYGNSIGLEKTAVSYELLKAPDEGVSFDSETNSVIISPDAEPGTILVEATLIPKFKGAVQKAVKTRYEFKLKPSTDEHYLPKAKNVTAVGSVVEKGILKADYKFWSYDSKEGESTYRWLYSETEDEGYEPIPEATSLEYEVEKEYMDYFIRFEVTPVDSQGRTGKPVKSNALRQPVAPVAKNIRITGEMSVGEILTGSYDFYDDNGDEEGISDFRWIRIEEDGTETTLLTDTGNAESGSSYTVTDEDMYCHLVFEVTPKSVSEPVGKQSFPSKPYLCAPNSVIYALSDIEVNGGGIEGFDSAVTEYDIYVPYVYKENDFETVPMPVVGATCVNEGAKVDVFYPDSSADGEKIVISIADADGQERLSYTLTIKTVGMNMFPDGGFEKEGKTAYKNGDFGPLTWDITENESAAGNRLLKGNGGMERNGFFPVVMYDKTVNGETGIYISPGKTYVNGFMAKLDPDRPANNEGNTFHATVRAGKDETDEYKRRNFAGQYIQQNGSSAGDYITLKDGEWGRYMNVFSGPANRAVRIGVGVGSNTTNHETYFLYDDMYLGELVISTINIADQDGKAESSMPVPSSNTSVFMQAMPVNQYGNLSGLDSSAAPVTWNLIQAPDNGVTFDKNNVRLDITPDAEPGLVVVEATVKPKYAGASQPYVKKRYKLTLEPVESSYIPKAKDVTADGIVATDEILQADYKFWSYDSDEGDSIYQWYASDNENGPFTAIAGATMKEYKVESAHSQHYIYFEVTPVDSQGRKGAAVKSRVLQKPTVPTVTEITISGDMIVGKTITASYEYYDPNGDSESGSTFRWLRSDKNGGNYTAIDKATSKSYKLTENDIDCYLKFEVTPKSTVVPKEGKPNESKPYLAAARPTAESVRIKSMGGGVYTASYIYKHPHNYPEGATEFNWYLNDSLQGSDMMLNLGSGASGVLKLEVITKSTANPYDGVPVYDTLTLRTGGSSGGGGGGGGSSGKSFTVADPIVPVYQPSESPNANKHWASDAVEFVVGKGIMKNLSENDFGYDNLVTRAEFVEYIIRGLNKGESEYKNIFGDVSASASYAGYLQTAVDMGMISVDTNFYPDRFVSREEICKILLYAIGDANCSEEDVTAEFTALVDSAQISQWAVGFVRKAMKVGLMKGMGENVFAPRGNTTRAQTAVIVKRISEWKQEG